MRLQRLNSQEAKHHLQKIGMTGTRVAWGRDPKKAIITCTIESEMYSNIYGVADRAVSRQVWVGSGGVEHRWWNWLE